MLTPPQLGQVSLPLNSHCSSSSRWYRCPHPITSITSSFLLSHYCHTYLNIFSADAADIAHVVEGVYSCSPEDYSFKPPFHKRRLHYHLLLFLSVLNVDLNSSQLFFQTSHHSYQLFVLSHEFWVLLRSWNHLNLRFSGYRNSLSLSADALQLQVSGLCACSEAHPVLKARRLPSFLDFFAPEQLNSPLVFSFDFREGSPPVPKQVEHRSGYTLAKTKVSQKERVSLVAVVVRSPGHESS